MENLIEKKKKKLHYSKLFLLNIPRIHWYKEAFHLILTEVVEGGRLILVDLFCSISTCSKGEEMQ